MAVIQAIALAGSLENAKKYVNEALEVINGQLMKYAIPDKDGQSGVVKEAYLDKYLALAQLKLAYDALAEQLSR
jgi:hypothetical protein